MMYYTFDIAGFVGVVRVADNETNLHIPADSGNVDYQTYLAWLDEGNTPEEWNPEQLESDD